MPASPEHGGKCRALWGDRGKRVYTGKNHLIPVPFARFLPLPLVGYGVSLTVAASLCSSKSGSLAFTLPHTFFITIFPTVFYDRSRMTGRQLILFCKKPFYLSVHTCPFRQPDGWHLPRQAGTACVFYSILFFLAQQMKNALEMQFTRAVILERWAEQEWWQEKNIMWLLAKNPARDTHKCVYKYKTWLLSSLASASSEHGGKRIVFLGA